MKKPLVSILTGGIALATTILVSSTTLAWGPERPTYTNESPADYATFNSITNNEAVGDERNFVRVKEAGTENKYTDELEIEAGKEYEVWVYYHNNAGDDTNESGLGLATDTRVSSAYPVALKKGDRGMISGIISWSFVTPSAPDDAQTGTVWDEAYLTTQSEENIVLRYKTGTATLHNSGTADGTILPTALFTKAGTPISYNSSFPGVIPGCAQYSGHITYTLVAEETSTDLKKQVSLDGENWSDSVTANPGDYVTYRVEFTNTGNTTLTNAIFTDTHDENLTLRPGSTMVYDVNHEDGLAIDDIIDISGYNMGDIAPGALVQIIYQAKVADDTEVCGKTLNNAIILNYNTDQYDTSASSVVVNCAPDCTANPDAPECQTCENNPNLPGCKTCITNPEMEGCQELPKTGPLEITLAAVIVVGIISGGYYFYRTKKTLKTVEETAKGEERQDITSETPETPDQPEQPDQPETPDTQS